MNTIMADMGMPVSSGGTASSKTGTESGEFGEIMKTQSVQDRKEPGAAGKKEGQDKDKMPVSDNVQPDEDETLENRQILSMLLNPFVPVPQMPAGDVNAGNAEDGTIQLNPAAALTPADVSDAGAFQESGPADTSENMTNIQAADINEAKGRDSGQTAFHFQDSPSADLNAVSEVTDAVREPEVMPEGTAEPEETKENQKTDTGKLQAQGRQASENVKSEKETSAYDKQDMSYVQDITAHGTAAVSESAAGRSEVKTDIRTEYMEQLKANIADSLASGRQEFEIQLNPANLGKLVIKASYEAGKAVISIVCSETRTMEAMSHQARELAAIVEDRTGNQTVVVVEHPAGDYLEQQADQQGKQQESHPDRQQKEENKSSFHESFDFLQQLRLGLA